MAHNPTSSDLTGPCENFFGAIIGTTALRAMRRVSHRPETPKSNIPAASTLPKYDPSAKDLISLQPQSPKPDISTASPLPISISAPAAKTHPGPGDGEAAEVVPIMFVPADEKKKSKVDMDEREKNFPVAIIASEMAPELQVASAKEDRAKPKAEIAGQAAKAKPNTGPTLEKLKSKADMAQPEKLTPWPGNPQVAKVAQKTELEKHVSVQEKLKPGVEIPTPNKTTPKVEAAAPEFSLQDKPKPQVDLQPKPVVEQGQKEEGNKTGHHKAAAPQVSLQDKRKPQVELQPKPVVELGQKEEGNKTGHHNIDHMCSAFIDRTKIIFRRATSDVGKSNLGADSSNTKMKAKTTSNVGGGKSASFKK